MKGYFITVKNGLLEPKHIKAMQVNSKTSAIWCYLWFLDKITKIVETEEHGSLGVVLGGRPIKLQEIADDLDLDIKTVRKMYHQLQEKGYIVNNRTPYGNIVSVTKAHKIFGQKPDIPHSGRSKVLRELPQRGRSGTENGRSDVQKTVGLGSENGRSNKTIQLDNTIIQYTPPPPPHEKITSMFDYWHTIIGIDQNRHNRTNEQACERLLKRFSDNEIKQLVGIVNKAHQDRYAPKIVKAADYFQLDRYSDDILIWAKSKVLTKERITKI